MRLQFVFTHSLHLAPPGLCVAWSFVTLQVFAPKPQPREDFPKPAMAKGALPTGHHPGFLTVSFSSLCVLRQGHLLRLAWNYKHWNLLSAGTTSTYQCTQLLFLLLLVFVSCSHVCFCRPPTLLPTLP